jgi:hypothetical protein
MTTEPAHEESSTRQLPRPALRLALLLYLVAISIDAIRKETGLPTSTESLVYLVVGAMYLILLPGIRSRLPAAPRYLPVWLVLLTLWCVVDAAVPAVPPGMAVLGWLSYVFFVPLLYIGAELMATDRSAARTLRIVAIVGGLVGLGAIASALLGQSAPTILRPIVPSVGVHSFSTGNIYLAPSVFATAEQAAEELLIALFAWVALAYLPSGRLRRASSAILGILIAVGLFATERRTDIVAAVIGMTALMILGSLAPHRRRTSRSTMANSRTGPALILGVIGSLTLISFLGASKIIPFLISGSDGQNALSLMFSPAYPGSFTGQGTGTSTQGAGLVGATSFYGIASHKSYFGYILNGRVFITAEGGLTKTWLELGILGVVLYGGVFLSVLGPAVHSLRRLDGAGRALTMLTIVLGIAFLKGHPSLDDPLVQPLFWLAAGGTWGRMRAHAARPEQEAGMTADAVRAGGYPSAATPQTDLG